MCQHVAVAPQAPDLPPGPPGLDAGRTSCRWLVLEQLTRALLVSGSCLLSTCW